MQLDHRIVDEAIISRRAIRGFLSTPVETAVVADILQVASRAPSGTNMQPWRVWVTSGDALDTMTSELIEAHGDKDHPRQQAYRYYPEPIPEPFLSRRRKLGWELYGLLGIKRGETDKMHHQHGKNFNFFGAPVGMIFTIDKRLEIGSWLDYGMFLQNIMIAARGRGLHTCPQAAFAPYPKIIRAHLDIPGSEVVICGMALGYADMGATENQLETTRVPLDEFVRFVG